MSNSWTFTSRERVTDAAGRCNLTITLRAPARDALPGMTARITKYERGTVVQFEHPRGLAFAVAEAARLVAQTYDTVGDLALGSGESIAPMVDLSDLSSARLAFGDPSALLVLAAYFGEPAECLLTESV
jgi:hypothetical protein